MPKAPKKKRTWWPSPEPGKVYGRWTVLSHSPTTYRSMCRCECGVIKNVLAVTLKNGQSRSCGCWKPDLMRSVHVTHGASLHGRTTKEYRSWDHMVQRCRNPASDSYQEYGGRGITVCDRWLNFSAFLADMGEAPTAKHSIDRINNDGPYEPGNCRWATYREQNLNRRNTVTAVVSGCQTPIMLIAERAGLPYATVRGRRRLGWPDDQLGVPKHAIRHKKRAQA